MLNHISEGETNNIRPDAGFKFISNSNYPWYDFPEELFFKVLLRLFNPQSFFRRRQGLFVVVVVVVAVVVAAVDKRQQRRVNVLSNSARRQERFLCWVRILLHLRRLRSLLIEADVQNCVFTKESFRKSTASAYKYGNLFVYLNWLGPPILLVIV